MGGFGSNSFDNIFDSMSVLFQVATGDDWETVMFSMADIPSEVDESPYRDDGWHSLPALFCVLFAFITQLFTMQLMVSVIIDAFYLIEGTGLLTAEQATVRDMHQYCKQLEPIPKANVPEERWRAFWYHFFSDVQPIPVEQIEECKATKYVPKNTFVADVESFGRNLSGTREFLAVQTDPRTIKKMETATDSDELTFKKMTQDDNALRSCSNKEFNSQKLPEAGIGFGTWVHKCGSKFDHVLTMCIVTNVMFISAVHYQQSQAWEDLIWWQNIAFNTLFTLEMIIKIIGLGFKAYWANAFDAYDGVVVLASWILAVNSRIHYPIFCECLYDSSASLLPVCSDWS